MAKSPKDKIRLLTFTTLFPNSIQSRHGIFVEHRLRQLLQSGKVETRVLAPIPWFPLKHRFFGSYAQMAQVPQQEIRHGQVIYHPRYLSIPKIGMSLAPYFLANRAIKVIKYWVKKGFDFDLIDAHYFYPDGVAAAMISQYFGKPFVVTARGTDINLIPSFKRPRQQIIHTAGQASAMITVCAALKAEMLTMGIDGSKIRVLRNGVDLKFFRPANRVLQREKLNIHGPSLLSVGHLTKRKGNEIIIAALPELPKVALFIVGDGEERENLRQQAHNIGVSHRVAFLGALTQQELCDYYGAVDALVLASSREGWANVLLESMACGTPVIASNVWGTPEVVSSAAAGVLMPERTPAGLVFAYHQLMQNYPAHETTRQYAEQYGWESTTQGQLDLFSEILKQN